MPIQPSPQPSLSSPEGPLSFLSCLSFYTAFKSKVENRSLREAAYNRTSEALVPSSTGELLDLSILTHSSIRTYHTQNLLKTSGTF